MMLRCNSKLSNFGSRLGSQLNNTCSSRAGSIFLSTSRKWYSTTKSEFKVAIVGSGPGGFYSSSRLLKLFDGERIKIDMFEKLPVPHGLVRYGVAPDHPEVKLVMNKFDEVAESPHFNFYGNVEIGKKLTTDNLRQAYDAVIYAYGASQDKTFGIPGEESKGVFSARSFVGWYNGDPDGLGSERPDLSSSDTAVVLGQGNVALDVARILLSPIEELAKTDITEEALDSLSKSKIRRVHIVGRRGPLQVAFTSKELREMFALPNTSVKLDEGFLLNQIQANKQSLSKKRALSRLMTLLITGFDENKAKFSNDLTPYNTCHLDFLRSPISFENDKGVLSGIRFGLNDLEGDPPRAVRNGNEEIIPCGIAFRSIGYKSSPLPGLPFDSNLGVVPNNQGRALNNGEEISGLYVSGWLKTGPIGVIVSTMMHANATADSVFEDFKNGKAQTGNPGLTTEDLIKLGLSPTNYQDWKKLEKYEFDLGSKRGKPREKIVNPEEMLKIIHC